jgi:hypothetical protein
VQAAREMAPVKEEVLAAGYQILQSGHRYGAAGDGESAYFDTLADFGTIFELIQIPTERREPDFVWQPRSTGSELWGDSGVRNTGCRCANSGSSATGPGGPIAGEAREGEPSCHCSALEPRFLP